jgi:thiol-disulfide isomerase/thioredoxin
MLWMLIRIRNTTLQDRKIIAYYFSAHWCPPCRLFTPVLADFYAVSFFY